MHKIAVNLSKVTVVLILLLASGVKASAQEERLGFGIGASVGAPHGVKIEAGLRLNPLLSLRGGISYLPEIKVYDDKLDAISFSGYKQILGYKPDMNSRASVSSVGGHLLADFHPWKNGFRITAGVFLNGPKASGWAQLVHPTTGVNIVDAPESLTKLNPDNMPKVTMRMVDENDQEIPGQYFTLQPNPDASLDVDVYLGQSIQPYFGLGYGYAVPYTPVTFVMDLGFLYGGGVQLSSKNVVDGDPNVLFQLHEKTKKIQNYTKFIPVLSLGVAIRIL